MRVQSDHFFLLEFVVGFPGEIRTLPDELAIVLIHLGVNYLPAFVLMVEGALLASGIKKRFDFPQKVSTRANGALGALLTVAALRVHYSRAHHVGKALPAPCLCRTRASYLERRSLAFITLHPGDARCGRRIGFTPLRACLHRLTRGICPRLPLLRRRCRLST